MFCSLDLSICYHYSCTKSSTFFDILKKYFYPILSNKCSIIFYFNIPVFKKKTSVLYSVKCEKTELFMVGVAKTKTLVLFSRQPISYFIYTPTSFSSTQTKSHQTQQNPHFSPIHLKNPNIAPNIVKPH